MLKLGLSYLIYLFSDLTFGWLIICAFSPPYFQLTILASKCTIRPYKKLVTRRPSLLKLNLNWGWELIRILLICKYESYWIRKCHELTDTIDFPNTKMSQLILLKSSCWFGGQEFDTFLFWPVITWLFYAPIRVHRIRIYVKDDNRR